MTHMIAGPAFGVTLLSDSLLLRGLEGNSSISGVALNTFGFLRDLESIWSTYGTSNVTTWLPYNL